MLSTTSTRRGRYEVKDGDEIISSHNEPDKAQDSARETALLRNKTIQIQPPIYEIKPVEIFEGIPTNVPAGSGLTMYEYWTATPSSTYLNSGSGVANSWPNTNVSVNCMSLAHSATGGAAPGTGYIEATILSPPASDQAQFHHYWSDDSHIAALGIPQREIWFRGAFQWDTASTAGGIEDIVDKFFYFVRQANVGAGYYVSAGWSFDHANMSGHRTATVTGSNMTYNSSTGMWEGTITTGLGTIADGTGCIFTDHSVQISWAGNKTRNGVAIKSYNSTTGAVEMYAKGGGDDWLSPPPVGANIKIMPDLGTTFTFSAGGNGTLVNVKGDNALDSATVTAATNANPCQITTFSAHGFSTGDYVYFNNVSGMTELNGNRYQITVVDGTHFTLDGTDSTAYGTYTSGGITYTQTNVFGSINLSSLASQGTAGTITFSDGVTITDVTLFMDSQRSTVEVFTDGTESAKIGMLRDSRDTILNQCFAFMLPTQQAYFDAQTHCGASPRNLAANSLNLGSTEDYANEDIELKMYININTNPWKVKMYLTNSTAAAAGITDGNSGIVAGKTHFNNCLYVELDYPCPASNIGFNLQWGDYFAHYLTSHQGEKLRLGYFELIDATSIGATDPFNAPFVTGLA